MSDLETLLRSTLAEHAAAVDPRPDAIREVISAVQRRRRIRSASQALAGAAAVGAIVVTVAVWHPIGPSAEPTLQPAATTTTTPTGTATTAATAAAASSPSPSTPSSSTPATTANLSTVDVRHIGVLNLTFSADWTPQPKSTSGFGGDLTLTPGSASATGLPAGYAAAVSYSLLGATTDSATGPVDTVTALCGSLVEKGATMKACVPQKVNRLTVQRSETDAPNTKVGTWANLRFLFKRPDELVQYTEITIWNTAHTTTTQERATATKWLNAQATQLRHSRDSRPLVSQGPSMRLRG